MSPSSSFLRRKRQSEDSEFRDSSRKVSQPDIKGNKLKTKLIKVKVNDRTLSIYEPLLFQGLPQGRDSGKDFFVSQFLDSSVMFPGTRKRKKRVLLVSWDIRK